MIKIIIIIACITFTLWLALYVLQWAEDEPNGNMHKAYFKNYYQNKIERIDYLYGRNTWKNFIKNDLKETYQAMKRISSKKVVTSDEYYKLRELVDEMERYIENSIEHSPTEELDIELRLLRKINAQIILQKIKERVK